MKIIVNALSGIGDAVMFSPALRVLKNHLPSAEIEMMVMYEAVGRIYSTNPLVSKIHFIDFLNQSAIKSFGDVISLRKNKYYASLNVYPSNRREYNVVNRMLGAKLRIAAKYNHYALSYMDFLNNRLSAEVKNRHNVLENFELIKFLVPEAKESELGPYEIFIPEADKQHAADYIKINKLENTPLVGFHAGSATFKGHINKRWDANKFAKLAVKLNKEYGARILLFGSERNLNNEIFLNAKATALIPDEIDIMQSIAVMEKCSLFVSNDSALMHIASALQVPTAAIFGYTNYNELRPWKSKHIIVRKELECSPCFFNSPKPVRCIFPGFDAFKCMKTITVDEVLEACRELIKEIPGNIKS